MSKTDNFHQLIEEWVQHCKTPAVYFGSSSADVRECEPYVKIVSMGYEALPLIRQVYDRDSSDNTGLSILQGDGLVGLVMEIVGKDFSIPKELRGNINAKENYTKK